MTTTAKVFIAPKEAESVQTTQYTAINCKGIIDKFTATNNGTQNETISVNLVNSGGSVGDANLIVKERAIAVNETYTFPELVGQLLESGSFVSTIASNPNVLTIRANGREIT